MTKDIYAVIDSSIISLVTQPMQHTLFNDFASRNDMIVSFYLTEDILTIDKLSTFQHFLSKKPFVKGFIFLRLGQLVGPNKLGLQFMHKILQEGYTLSFVREKIDIKDNNSLNQLRAEIRVYEKTSAIADYEQECFLKKRLETHNIFDSFY